MADKTTKTPLTKSSSLYPVSDITDLARAQTEDVHQFMGSRPPVTSPYSTPPSSGIDRRRPGTFPLGTKSWSGHSLGTEMPLYPNYNMPTQQTDPSLNVGPGSHPMQHSTSAAYRAEQSVHPPNTASSPMYTPPLRPIGFLLGPSGHLDSNNPMSPASHMMGHHNQNASNYHQVPLNTFTQSLDIPDNRQSATFDYQPMAHADTRPYSKPNVRLTPYPLLNDGTGVNTPSTVGTHPYTSLNSSRGPPTSPGFSPSPYSAPDNSPIPHQLPSVGINPHMLPNSSSLSSTYGTTSQNTSPLSGPHAPSTFGANPCSPPEIGFSSHLSPNVSTSSSFSQNIGNVPLPSPNASPSFPQSFSGNALDHSPGHQGLEGVRTTDPGTQTYFEHKNCPAPEQEYLSFDLFDPHFYNVGINESSGYTQSPAFDPVPQSNIVTQAVETQTVSAPEGNHYETLETTSSADPESESFLAMVADLKKMYVSTDESTNPGFLFNQIKEPHGISQPINVIVHSSLLPKPFVYKCSTDDKAEHVIQQALQFTSPCGNHPVNFILKVFSQTEYLINDLPLASFEYTHSCLTLGIDVKLELLQRDTIPKPFLRNIADDSRAINILKDTAASLNVGVLSFQEVSRMLYTFYQKADSLLQNNLHVTDREGSYRDLETSVKDICGALSGVETLDITEALAGVKKFYSLQSTSFGVHGGSLQAASAFTSPQAESPITDLIAAVKSLVCMYCKAYHTEFGLAPRIGGSNGYQKVTEINDPVSLGVVSLHRIPSDWRNSFDKYRLICSLVHGNRKLTADVTTSFKPTTSNFYRGIVWNEELHFTSVPYSKLPSETRMCFLLCGQRRIPADVKTTTVPATVPLCAGAIQLFSEKGLLLQGSQLVPLASGSSSDFPSTSCKALLSNSILLQVNLRNFKKTISYPEHVANQIELKPFTALSSYTRTKIDNIVEKNSMTCSQPEYQLLWEHRQHLMDQPALYPCVLRAVPSWDWSTVCEVCGLLNHWKDIHPFQALELLLPDFPDIRVRQFVTNKLSQSSPDDLVSFLPQLIQALKFESYHNSPLAKLLLEQSCKSPRFAHQLFWLLRGIASQETSSQHRYKLLFAALASVSGQALCHELKKQEELVRLMTSVTEQVKHATDKDTTLSKELTTVSEMLNRDGQMFLPHNLGMEVTILEFKNCSYFSSNAVPMKFVFKNSNTEADPHYLIYKIGDDLRQDMLTMQMIGIMDSLWLKHGLDLKMIKFTCLTTGPEKGIIDMVRKSETLHNIQARFGMMGSFKDEPILAWLQEHNPVFADYKKAIENFTLSCAGYCVATYIMGICDRHNDNIMIKESGHMFHIDFGKFLGDSQMFGNFKRDRVPFVFTSDMAYVITDGGKHTEKFQHFVDLCCQAFNILREHADLLRSLFALMSRSGIHMVTDQAVHYVQGTLLLGLTKAEATAKFTRMIQDSLRSFFTKMNFLAHNLVHLDTTSATSDNLLSFVPKNHSKETDGQIKSVEIFGHEKRYTPEKHYIFIFMVIRENQTRHAFIFRHFSEIMEWRDQLSVTFPYKAWPDFSTRYVIGRSNIHTVADSRKLEIENLLKFIWSSGKDIAESDLVHTFFHTLHRDEEEAEKSKLQSVQWAETSRHPTASHAPSDVIQGEIKLSVQYTKRALEIMVMHVKDLAEEHILPSAYVKTRLLPDIHNVTKRKTKAVRRTCNPTFNEVFRYKMPLGQIQERTLLVAVWNEELLSRRCLGAVYIQLSRLDLNQENTAWHKLCQF